MKILAPVLSLLLFGAVLSVRAAETLPAGGTPVFPGDALDALKLVGDDVSKGSSESVTVEGPVSNGPCV